MTQHSFHCKKWVKQHGVCWNTDLTDKEKNIKRGISCIKSGHGRVMEWINIEFIIEDVSARCIRELGRHCVGTSYLQSSTRYVSEENGFNFYIPPKIENNENAENSYIETMKKIQEGYNKEIELGMHKEDAANLLPLGMNTKIVWKINLRSMVNFCQKRLCTRALKEIRDLSVEIKKQLAAKNEEWAWIADNLFVPTCEIYKYRNPNLVFCPEQQCCGRHKKIEDLNVLGQ